MDSNNWRVKRDPSEVPPIGTPNRSFLPRRSNGLNDFRNTPRTSGTFDQRPSPAGRSPLPSPRDQRKPLNQSQAEKAIDEGRRLYVGNLPYDASVQDIEVLFKDVSVEAINMSVDPFTKRNPSFCFVDLQSKELAQRVMEQFDGQNFRERPLKVKPGVKSGATARTETTRQRPSDGSDFAFDRWRRLENPEELNVAAKEGRRLYVGGLPRFSDQVRTNLEMKELFAGFNVEIVSKLISAHDSKKDEPGHHNYCFVELATVDEATKAIREVDGISRWDSIVKVRETSGHSGKLRERRRLFVGALPEFPDAETAEARIKELFEGFDVTMASKLFLPKDGSKNSEDGNHCFCFVEFSSDEETDRALKLDWTEKWGSSVRVKPANTNANANVNGRSTREVRGWGPRD